MKKHLVSAACILFLLGAGARAQVVVRVGPPPARPREIRPVPPPAHRDWVWHPGYHRWDGARYVWVPGEYVAPPRPGAVWIPGHWVHRRGGWLWIEGHWR